MKYNLVNENFQDNYVERLIESRGGDYNKLLNIGPESLNSPDLLDNIEKGVNLFLTKIKANDSKKLRSLRIRILMALRRVQSFGNMGNCSHQKKNSFILYILVNSTD